MGFNFGAFAGGAADGITAGSNLADQMQQRQVRQAQLDALKNGQLGQQAYTNSMIPGATPVPAGAGASPGIVPILQQMPLIGQIGSELGLWDAPAQQGGMPQGGPAPAMAGSPASAPRAPSQGIPQPAPQAAAQPQSGAPTIQDVAMAIDKANPGLRASNPAAFSQAVQLGYAHVQESLDKNLDREYKGAQIGSVKAQTEVHKGDAILAPQKLKVQEAEVKLKELQADSVQAKMRLDEAELNAKSGDYSSQREYRDAQIAKMRADRMHQMQKDRTDKLKTDAEVKELKARADMHGAHADYYDSKSTGGASPVAKDKVIHNELTKASVQLRHYDNMKRSLLQSINPNEPRIKSLIAETDQFIGAYRQRVNDLESQLSTAKKPEAPTTQENPFNQGAATEIPAPRQQELGKLADKFLSYARSGDMEGGRKLSEFLRSKGVPPHEIEWAATQARSLYKQQQSSPQVPMSVQ